MTRIPVYYDQVLSQSLEQRGDSSSDDELVSVGTVDRRLPKIRMKTDDELGSAWTRVDRPLAAESNNQFQRGPGWTGVWQQIQSGPG